MSRQSVQQMINNGIVIPPLEIGVPVNISTSTDYVRKLELTMNDTLTMTLKVLASSASPNIVISIYRLSNNIVYPYVSRTTSAWNFSFNQGLILNTYIVEISSKVSTDLTLTNKMMNFVQIKTFPCTLYHGEDFDATLTTKKKPQECHEALEYELIEGDLPPGLKLYSTGLIEGVVGNLDCVEDITQQYSPSFNWYFSNHDGMSQSWARQWRFKVRVKIASQPGTNIEQWFCIKTYNNWSADAAVFDSMTDEDTEVLTNITTVSLPEISKPKPANTTNFIPAGLSVVPNYYVPVTNCVPCNDPTTPVIEETYSVPAGLTIRTPNELLDYYINNQSNFEPLVMQLHNSKILSEYIKTIGTSIENPDIMYFMEVKDSKITLKKYYTDATRSFDDIDQLILSNRTISNQISPNDLVIYNGEHLTGVLTW